MLVLTSKKYQKILIGDDIVVTVVEIRNGQVRLGVEAPPEVPIVRDELVDGGKVYERPKGHKPGGPRP